MALRTSLAPQPHLYMGDTTGKPLDYGMVYFGEPNKDPEYYPIDIYYDESLTVAAAQPVRTKGGFLNANGDMVEVYAAETEYSVKVLDGYGRQVFYQAAMSRNNTDGSISTQLPYPNTIIRTLADRNTDTVSVKDFGAVGDGVTDDTEALTAAFNSGIPVSLSDADYVYTQIVVNEALNLTGSGRLKYSGDAGGNGVATLIFNGAVKAESLIIRTNGASDLIYDIAHFNADNVDIGTIDVRSVVQRNERGGFIFKKGNINIGSSYSENIGRPLAFSDSDNTGLWRSNINIGKVVSKNYLRGISFSFVDNVSLDSAHIEGMWQGLGKAPGYNGIIFGTCKNFHLGNIYIADSLEHGFRIGGLDGSENWSIGQLYTKDTLGCGFKTAPLAPEKVKNGKIGSITVVNAGRGGIAGNQEAVRLSSVTNLEIDSINVLQHATKALTFADANKVRIGSVYGENLVERVMVFDENLDSTIGSCEDIFIGKMVGYCIKASSSTAVSMKYSSAGRAVKNLNIADAFITGFSGSAMDLDSANISESYVNFTVPSIDDLATIANVVSDSVYCTIKKLGETYTGKAKSIIVYGEVRDGDALNLSSASARPANFISSLPVTSSQNTHGAWLGFGRLGSSRRGGAIALKQTGASSSRNGLSFCVQSTSSATDATLIETMVLKDTGTVSFALLPTTTTGLVSGDIWRDGNVLKIV